MRSLADNVVSLASTECDLCGGQTESWWTSAKLGPACDGERGEMVESSSRMRFGKALVMKPKSMQDDVDAVVSDAAPTTEIRVAAGTQEEVVVSVVKGQRLNVAFDVLEGRDIDFGIMLLAEGEETPTSLYGPSRRATKLQTSIPVPATGTVHLGFDTSYTWISSKLVRYSAVCSADELC